MKIAYLGPEGTYTHALALKNFPDAELVSVNPIRKVISLVEEKKVDLGLVPLENFYNGEVRETLDSLNEMNETKIIAELFLEINHCLGALGKKEDITEILSKDQALEQCGAYLSKKYPNALTISISSTAEAVMKIAKNKLLNSAAIASEKTILDNGLKVMDKDICPKNRTRFVLLGKNLPKSSGEDKTFISIHPFEDRAGILYECLGIISKTGVNLEYIQSRPDGNKGYIFYIELDGHFQDEKVKNILNNLKNFLDPKNIYPKTLKIIGSYKDIRWKD